MGFSFESPDQKEPIFDAKGIETVRRDSCPAVGKVRTVRATDLIGPGAILSLAKRIFSLQVLEKSLCLLFKCRDVSVVKCYVQREFRKLLEGRVNIQEFTFAKEYRGRQYYRPGARVPALELTK